MNYKVEIYETDSDWADYLFGMVWIWKVTMYGWVHIDYARTREKAETKARKWIANDIKRRNRFEDGKFNFEVQG